MDADGYPTKGELKRIKAWDAIKDAAGLVEYIEGLWAYPDYFHWNAAEGTLELHTAGWSGNEDIVGALQKNLMFWALYWVKSERGGHYWFTVKEAK